jgi:Zinc-binding dehydrogenase
MVDSIQGLRPDGRLVTMGADSEPLSISLMDLIAKRIRIIGSQQNGPEYLYEALDFVAQGKVKTIVETYPLAEAPKAYDRVAEGKARFRGSVPRCPHNVIPDPSRRPLFRADHALTGQYFSTIPITQRLYRCGLILGVPKITSPRQR